MKFSGTVDVMGNAYLYNGAVMTLTGNTTVNGTLFYDSISSVVKNGSSAVAMPMSTEDMMLRGDILDLAAAADSETATQPVDPANPSSMNLSSSTMYIADPMKDVNVISATNISLSSGQTITFVGNATSIFILKISGTADFGEGIVLNGPAANHVLIYITNASSSSTVSVGGPAGVAGTFLSLTRPLKFTGQGTFEGALISGSTSNPAIAISGNGGGDAAQFEAKAFCTTE